MPFMQRLAARGVRSAQAWVEAVPQPYPDTADAIDAFETLTQGRPHGMSGPLPIPLSEIAAYIQLYRVPDADRLVRLIRVLDRAYLKETYGRDQPASTDRRQRRGAGGQGARQ